MLFIPRFHISSFVLNLVSSISCIDSCFILVGFILLVIWASLLIAISKISIRTVLILYRFYESTFCLFRCLVFQFLIRRIGVNSECFLLCNWVVFLRLLNSIFFCWNCWDLFLSLLGIPQSIISLCSYSCVSFKSHLSFFILLLVVCYILSSLLIDLIWVEFSLLAPFISKVFLVLSLVYFIRFLLLKFLTVLIVFVETLLLVRNVLLTLVSHGISFRIWSWVGWIG